MTGDAAPAEALTVQPSMNAPKYLLMGLAVARVASNLRDLFSVGSLRDAHVTLGTGERVVGRPRQVGRVHKERDEPPSSDLLPEVRVAVAGQTLLGGGR